MKRLGVVLLLVLGACQTAALVPYEGGSAGQEAVACLPGAASVVVAVSTTEDTGSLKDDPDSLECLSCGAATRHAYDRKIDAHIYGCDECGSYTYRYGDGSVFTSIRRDDGWTTFRLEGAWPIASTRRPARFSGGGDLPIEGEMMESASGRLGRRGRDRLRFPRRGSWSLLDRNGNPVSIRDVDPEAFLGMPVTRPGSPITRPGHAVTRPSHPVTRPDHPVTRPSHPVSRPGFAVRRPSHPVTRPSHSVERPNRGPVDRPSHPVTRPSHPVERPGFAVTRPGHPLTRPGSTRIAPVRRLAEPATGSMHNANRKAQKILRRQERLASRAMRPARGGGSFARARRR